MGPDTFCGCTAALEYGDWDDDAEERSPSGNDLKKQI